jgi:hypothetical protein
VQSCYRGNKSANFAYEFLGTPSCLRSGRPVDNNERQIRDKRLHSVHARDKEENRTIAAALRVAISRTFALNQTAQISTLFLWGHSALKNAVLQTALKSYQYSMLSLPTLQMIDLTEYMLATSTNSASTVLIAE